jgi:PKHD-type hydroxylase
MSYNNSHLIIDDPLDSYFFNPAFTDEEIAQIETLANSFPQETAQVGEAGNVDQHLRKSVVRWIERTPQTEWIYQRMLHMINQANEGLFKFNLIGEPEKIQYTEYYEDGGHYDYHLDMGKGFPLCTRKVSIAVQLSDADAYEGGDFEILRGSNPEKMLRGKGVALVFPSYLLHRVTPVTKGIRKSLVMWVGGSSFK